MSRFYNPVPASGGKHNNWYAIRGEGGHHNRLIGRDMNLTWDQADRLCDVLDEVREYAREESMTS